MNLHVIHTGNFKMDGGAMFGVVPKTIWERSYPADEKNLTSWAMRCLLIEDGDRLILIDTGIGNKQSEKFFGYYFLHGDQSLHSSLHQAGFSRDDITDVFLTHLHFDHVGGALEFANGSKQTIKTTFPRATYWSNEAHWQWAMNSNPREKASFLKENLQPLADSGQLEMVDLTAPSPFTQFDILTVNGHTEKQMIPLIKYRDKKIVFAADLLPSVGHIPLPYVMSFDVRPLLTMEEKKAFLKEALNNQYYIFFEHDPSYEVCTLQQTEKGIRMKNTFLLEEIK